MDEDNKPKPKPVRFNTEIFGVINDAVTANAAHIQQLFDTFMVLEKGAAAMYDVVMEYHKRLNRLEKEFLALERKINEKDNPR